MFLKYGMPTNLGNIVIGILKYFLKRVFLFLLDLFNLGSIRANLACQMENLFRFMPHLLPICVNSALNKDMNIHQGCWELYSRFAHISDTSNIVYCFGYGSVSFPESMEADCYNKLIIKNEKQIQIAQNIYNNLFV